MSKIIHKTQNHDTALDALLPQVRTRILQCLANGETEHARIQLAILEKIAKISRLITENQTPKDHHSHQEQRENLMAELEERFTRLSQND